jgi:hypothetical protein
MVKLLLEGVSNFNGSSCNRLARLNADGSLDTSFSLGVGFDKTSMRAVQSDNKLIIGGIFILSQCSC